MPLVVRNVSVAPLRLKRTELYDGRAPARTGNDKVGILNSIRNALMALMALFYTRSYIETDGDSLKHAESLDHQDVDIQIDGLSTYQTAIETSKENILRLIFEHENQRYRIDIHPATSESVIMTPMDEHAKQEFSIIYTAEHCHLAIFSALRPSRWMGELQDDTSLAALSIPGTHNSPTCYRALPSVRCQAVSPTKQLENGVRFFDVRVQVENPTDLSKDGLILVHSAFPVSLTGTKHLRQLVSETLKFLDENPSETVIMCLKREGTGKGTDHQLAHILHTHYVSNDTRWYTEPHIPRLRDVRGKIVLLRRFGIDDTLKNMHNGKGWGINGEVWADNTPHAISPSGELCVQDFYEVLDTKNIDEKIKYSTEQLDRAAAMVAAWPQAQSTQYPNERPLFVNFLTASNFWRVGCWPEKIAAKLNPTIVDYLCRIHNEPVQGKKTGDGATGIVVCDWVGNGGNWDLVRAIVGMNSKLLLRQRQR